VAAVRVDRCAVDGLAGIVAGGGGGTGRAMFAGTKKALGTADCDGAGTDRPPAPAQPASMAAMNTRPA
jgi:hypothetical protein